MCPKAHEEEPSANGENIDQKDDRNLLSTDPNLCLTNKLIKAGTLGMPCGLREVRHLS